jgi:hypothetical protein
MNEEEALINAFFLPARRQRYIDFAKSPRTRRKFLDELSHSTSLDVRFRHEIPGVEQTPEGITRLLQSRGAGDQCIAISDFKEIDAKRLNLKDAVSTVLGRTFGTLLSCRPGRLAYFENEDGRWILERAR